MASPSPPSSSSSSRAQLASLLADTTKEVESLRKALAESQRRASHFEALSTSHQFVSGSKEEAVQAHIRSLEQRLHEAEVARDTEAARRVALTDLWAQYKNYVEVVESYARDARAGFDDVVRAGGGILHLMRIPRMEDIEIPPRSYRYENNSANGTNKVRRRSDSLENGIHPSKRPRNQYPPPSSHSFYQQPPPHPTPPPQQQHPQQRHHGGHRSPGSNDSMDVDEMIIQASSSSTSHPHPNHRYPENPYPNSNKSYTAQQAPQQHVFAPVVTGQPTRKRATGLNLVDDNGVPNGPASAPAATSYPATNNMGQRICRTCGMVGRYKDGKCVEKWGPGPWGPGTVCDRCRKKMKRVERRGTLNMAEQQNQINAQQQQQQQQQHTPNNPPPNVSPVQSVAVTRTDTVVTMRESPDRVSSLQHPQSQARLISSPRPTTATQSQSQSQTQVQSDEDADADADADEETLPPPAPAAAKDVNMKDDKKEEEVDADLLEAVEASESASGSERERDKDKVKDLPVEA